MLRIRAFVPSIAISRESDYIDCENEVHDTTITSPIQDNRELKLANVFVEYQKKKVLESNTILGNERVQLLNIEEKCRRKAEYLRKLNESFEKLDEAPRYVAAVQKHLGQNLLKVKLGSDVLVVKHSSDLKKTDIKPNTKVAIRFLHMSSMEAYKILTTIEDPMVSLMLVQKNTKVSYEQIGGLTQQIQEIKEVIELPIKHPEIFESLGISQPKGVLLYGAPGTGKTLLARAVAHHTDCSFFSLSGTELVQKYIGEGARMVRELFLIAREKAPSIIFIDEVDSIGSTRSNSEVGAESSGISSSERTMIELLNQLDGFEDHQNIKVVMATNRIDTLDPALIRPGRIDRKIAFTAPNTEARVDILRVHSKKMNLGRNVDLKEVAIRMTGASGAELKAVCQEAAMSALREGRCFVTQDDFLQKIEKVMQSFNRQVLSMSFK